MTRKQLDALRDATKRYTDKSAIPMLLTYIDEQQRKIDNLRSILEGVCDAIRYESNNDGGWGKRIDHVLKEVRYVQRPMD